jgi:hypothetical protein
MPSAPLGALASGRSGGDQVAAPHGLHQPPAGAVGGGQLGRQGEKDPRGLGQGGRTVELPSVPGLVLRSGPR